MSKYKYSIEDLERIVKESYTVMEVMRKLNIRMAGGSHYNLSNKIKKHNIDTSHFLGARRNVGVEPVNRKRVSEIFVILPEGSNRPKRAQLFRAMIESGFEYCCSICHITTWNGQDVTLEIDHVDGNWLNNLKENLRFICPNCHSQQKNTNIPHKYRSE